MQPQKKDKRSIQVQSYSCKQLGNNRKQIILNQKYEIDAQNRLYQTIDFIIPMIKQKQEKTKNHFDQHLGITYFPTIQFQLGKHKLQQQICTICMDNFQIQQIQTELSSEKQQDVYQLKCSHKFHKGCLKQYLKGKQLWIKCPICFSIFGIMKGDMPDGKMTVTQNKNIKCSGYKCGTYIINYSMLSGLRHEKKFPGTSRTAYLPMTTEGAQVLKLLRVCFDRKLTFTIGRSVTTGKEHVIVWNGIHHKTSTSGGPANFGYPDETYFKRVKQELAAKGIVSQ